MSANGAPLRALGLGIKTKLTITTIAAGASRDTMTRTAVETVSLDASGIEMFTSVSENGL
jgi:hypothetical protein